MVEDNQVSWCLITVEECMINVVSAYMPHKWGNAVRKNMPSRMSFWIGAVKEIEILECQENGHVECTEKVLGQTQFKNQMHQMNGNAVTSIKDNLEIIYGFVCKRCMQEMVTTNSPAISSLELNTGMILGKVGKCRYMRDMLNADDVRCVKS